MQQVNYPGSNIRGRIGMSVLLLLAACAPVGTDQGDSSPAAPSTGAGGMPARPAGDDGTGNRGVGRGGLSLVELSIGRTDASVN